MLNSRLIVVFTGHIFHLLNKKKFTFLSFTQKSSVAPQNFFLIFFLFKINLNLTINDATQLLYCRLYIHYKNKKINRTPSIHQPLIIS